MKKILPVILSGILLIGSCRVNFCGKDADYTFDVTSEKLARGKNLTMNICGQCHWDYSSGALIGARMHDFPRVLGKLYSSNLTSEPEKGVGAYSDAELAWLIKTGISRNGKFIPYMVRPTMADEDVYSVIAYLRSGDYPVQPVDTIVGKTHYSLPGKLIMKVVAGNRFEYTTGYQSPAGSDTAAVGAYLVNITGCYHCHSQSLTAINYSEPEKTKGYMSGGTKMKSITGKTVYTSNHTPDKITGIGNFTKEEFVKAVKTGISKGDKMLHYPMPVFHELTDEQASSIYAYLQTLKPVNKKIRQLD